MSLKLCFELFYHPFYLFYQPSPLDSMAGAIWKQTIQPTHKLDFLDAHYIIEFAYMQVVGGSENITNSYQCIYVSSCTKFRETECILTWAVLPCEAQNILFSTLLYSSLLSLLSLLFSRS